jgi:hypothetical protein
MLVTQSFKIVMLLMEERFIALILSKQLEDVNHYLENYPSHRVSLLKQKLNCLEVQSISQLQEKLQNYHSSQSVISLEMRFILRILMSFFQILFLKVNKIHT